MRRMSNARSRCGGSIRANRIRSRCEDQRTATSPRQAAARWSHNASTNREGSDESGGCHSPRALRCVHVHVVTDMQMTIVIPHARTEVPLAHAPTRRRAYTRGLFVHERGFAMRRSILFAVIAGLCLTAAAQAAPAENVSGTPQPFSTAITAQGFRAYDKGISSDTMGGRKPGTPGAERATAWIVEKFKALGLQPGNRGSWFQKVPTVSTALENPEQIKLTVGEGGGNQTFNFGKDLVASTLQAKPKIRI